MEFESVIGLEVHAQLKTETKLFCNCSTKFGDSPNTNVCPVCLGMPGSLPVLNKRAVEMAVMAGLALNCTIQKESVFARKNYFYPDLPKGYQISQFELPVCLGGYVDIEVNGQIKRIGITRIHMEEDAGKLLHQGAESIAGATHSLVDLNRACTPLIEIVSEPDIRSAEEARVYVETLRQILRHIGVNDGNMEEGNLRVDINLSIRPKGQHAFGTRTEVKNVNSFRSIERAIASEFNRQKEIVLSGGRVIQQTRNYHDDTQETTPLRDKEDAHDYRYFPEPDLLPLQLTEAFIRRMADALPELPVHKKERYLNEFQLTDADTKLLFEELSMDRYFEDAVKASASAVPPKELCKWIVGDLNALIKEADLGFDRSPVSAAALVSLLSMIQSGKVSGKMGKEILVSMFKTGESAEEAVKKMGGGQISNSSDLQPVINRILAENPDVVEKIRSGKTQSANFLMGQVMKATQGRANPDLVRQLILDSVTK